MLNLASFFESAQISTFAEKNLDSLLRAQGSILQFTKVAQYRIG